MTTGTEVDVADDLPVRLGHERHFGEVAVTSSFIDPVTLRFNALTKLTVAWFNQKANDNVLGQRRKRSVTMR